MTNRVHFIHKDFEYLHSPAPLASRLRVQLHLFSEDIFLFVEKAGWRWTRCKNMKHKDPWQKVPFMLVTKVYSPNASGGYMCTFCGTISSFLKPYNFLSFSGNLGVTDSSGHVFCSVQFKLCIFEVSIVSPKDSNITHLCNL